MIYAAILYSIQEQWQKEIQTFLYEGSSITWSAKGLDSSLYGTLTSYFPFNFSYSKNSVALKASSNSPIHKEPPMELKGSVKSYAQI